MLISTCDLQRKRRQRNGQKIEANDGKSFSWDTAESRPLVKSVAKEGTCECLMFQEYKQTHSQLFPCWDTTKKAGQDYWMDPQDVEKEKLREEAIKNRKSLEGEVPKEKLRAEIAAPYKQVKERQKQVLHVSALSLTLQLTLYFLCMQNWIGYFSVFIAILSVIGKTTESPKLRVFLPMEADESR